MKNEWRISYRGTIGGNIERRFASHEDAAAWLRKIGRPELIEKIQTPPPKADGRR